jgi:putative ABC transport system substrate-binding protein
MREIATTAIGEKISSGGCEIQIDRRSFLAGCAAAASAGPSEALAQTAKSARLGTLSVGPPFDPKAGRGAIIIGALAKRGYTLGQNLAYEARGAAGKMDQLPALMQELKAAGVGAVLTIGYPAAVAAKASGVPTVIAGGAGDPVATGLVNSLAHPGGNVTGISDDAATLSTKRLGLLKELLPQLRRVAMLWNKDDLAMSLRYEASAKAAQGIGVTVQPLGVREPNDFEEAFTAMNRERPDAILMVSDSLTLLNRKRVVDYAAERRIPAIYESDVIVRDGGLMSYGSYDNEALDRAADLAARIFAGANPSDLPVEQPTRYLLVINLKTANAMDLAVPATLLALADELIE